jgi:hypothetical protein
MCIYKFIALELVMFFSFYRGGPVFSFFFQRIIIENAMKLLIENVKGSIYFY